MKSLLSLLVITMVWGMLSISAKAESVEAPIPSELCPKLMEALVSQFDTYNDFAVRNYLRVATLTAVTDVTTLAWPTSGPNRTGNMNKEHLYKSALICKRNSSGTNCKLIETNPSRFNSASEGTLFLADSFTGILHKLLPVPIIGGNGYWGTKTYKNIECYTSPYNTSFCKLKWK